MDPVTMSFIATGIQFITKYGVPAAIEIIGELKDKDEPTLEEIQAIGARMKDPEEYFEK